MPRSPVLGVGEKRIEARATELSRFEMPNLGAPRSLPQIRPAAVGIASVVGRRPARLEPQNGSHGQHKQQKGGGPALSSSGNSVVPCTRFHS